MILHESGLGRVLCTMSGYCRERATLRRDYLGDQNYELLMALSHAFFKGAEACLQMSQEDEPNRLHGAFIKEDGDAA